MTEKHHQTQGSNVVRNFQNMNDGIKVSVAGVDEKGARGGGVGGGEVAGVVQRSSRIK